ncbi:M28 family peptidase [Labilibacter marinus]|uniref:M28 family peptidase n=1 Tax=Labilibacter marinus TaxID=1477105 RepID=UPI00094F7C5B|nr:M28 family peptidase [Labilibacter marinus]
MQYRLILLFTIALCSFTFSKAQNADLKASLKKHVEILASDSLQGRGIGTVGKTKAVDYIASHFKAADISSIGPSYLHHFDKMDQLSRISLTNVVGLIEGKHPELKDEYIVLGAHYDHLGWREKKKGEDDITIYNGADDNASGTATIIELAHLLAKEKMDRSIILVAFDGEESGLWGSAQFLKDSIVDPSQIKMMFSLDMVGMYDEYGGVDLTGLDLLMNGTAMLNQANTHQVKINKTGDKKENRTDTKSFLDKNIPAAHVFTGLDSPYHKPEDTAEKLDYDGMEEICILMKDFTIYMANQDELVANQAVEKVFNPNPTFTVGYKLGIGTSHLSYKESSLRSKYGIGIETGLQTQLKLSKSLFLATDVLYEYSKNRLETGNINLHSLTVPMQIKLKTKYTDAYSPRLFVSAGAYYSYHFAQGMDMLDELITEDNINDDFGICFGLGMELQRFTIDYTWRRASNDMISDENMFSLSRNTSKFSVGYRF